MDTRLRLPTQKKRIPHALVIDGSTFEERLAAARRLAQILVCDAADSAPCGQCGSCKKAAADIHPDIIFVKPEEKRKTLSVEVIRRMREDAYTVPNESECKVYIIAHAELMQDYAQNALLKILEEPPSYASFILLCPSHTVLLQTVLSRSTVFSLSDIDTETDNEEQKIAQSHAVQIAAAVAQKNEVMLLKAASAFEKNYEILALSLNCFALILRDALVLSAGGTELISESSAAQAKMLASVFSAEQLFSLQSATSDIVRAIDIYSNKNLTMTRLSSLLMKAAGA